MGDLSVHDGRNAHSGLIGSIDTLVACSSTRFSNAKYLLRIAPNTKVSFRVQLEGSQVILSNVATTNGGAGLSFAPTLHGADITRVGDQVEALLLGNDLLQVVSASYVSPRGEHLLVPEIREISANSLVLVLNSPKPLPPGGFMVSSGYGASTAIPFAGEPEHVEEPAWATTHFLVRFEEQAILPPPQAAGGLVADFQYSSPTIHEGLVQAGVRSLERLLPWLRPEDTHTVDVRGDSITLDDLSSLYVAHLTPGVDVQTAITTARALPSVRYAHVDMVGTGMFDPNDPLYSTEQWGLHYTGIPICTLFPGDPFTNAFAPSAWDRTTGSQSVRIAIIDSGIEALHPDLAGRVDPGISFVPGTTLPVDDTCAAGQGYLCHGTAVAGIAGATGNNGIGIAGMDWGARLVPVKVLNGANTFLASWLIAAIDWARSQGIPIANMSLGYFDGAYSPDVTLALADVCLNAFRSGVLLVAASGNVPVVDQSTDATIPAYPAALHQRVTAVGAILPEAQRWRDYWINPNIGPYHQASNYGPEGPNVPPWLDLEAAGGRFITTTRSAGFGPPYYDLQSCDPLDFTSMGFSGTSAAAPIVSGAAALLKSYKPELTAEDMEQLLKITSYNIHAQPINFNDEHGHGYVRAGMALDLVAAPNLITHLSATAADPYGIGSLVVQDSSATLLQRTFVGVPGLPSGTYVTQCRRYRLATGVFFPFAYAQTPRLWIRSATSEGWRDTSYFNYFYEVPWARAFGVSTTNAFLETYVYRILKQNDPSVTLGWFPVEPSKARIDFTLLGVPASTTSLSSAPPSAGTSILVYPNPVGASAYFTLTLEFEGNVKAQIFDVGGRHVMTLVDAPFRSGRHEMFWDAMDADGARSPAGIYFIRIETVSGVTTRRFALINRGQ